MRDHGDRAVWRWRPDRARPRAQNLPAIVEIVRDTARRVGEAIDAGERTIVLGGDCTVGIGTIAAHVATGERVGLVYFDTHADLNVPSSVPEGAMDWMGMAHVLGVAGAEAELVAAGPRTPLLEPGDVLLFGWGPDQATSFEREVIDALGIAAIPVGEVSGRDPSRDAGARRGWRALRPAARALRRRRHRLHRHAAVGELGAQRGPAFATRDGRARGAAAIPEARRAHDHRVQPRPRRGGLRGPRAARRDRRRRAWPRPSCWPGSSCAAAGRSRAPSASR